LADTAVHPSAAGLLGDELTGLIAAAYASHEGLPARARAFERAALDAGDTRHAELARLVLADVDNRSGRRAEGIRTAYAVLSSSQDRLVVAHAHAVIAGGLWRLGDNAEAVKHAYKADRLLVEGDPLGLRVDHAIIFALQVNDQRMAKASYEEYRMAQALAERLGNPDLIVANLNNWAWSGYLNDELDIALALVRRILDYSRLIAQPVNTSVADTIARVFSVDGQHERAIGVLEDALVHSPSTDVDAVPACLITYAEIRLAQGDVRAAVDLLDRCREITQRDQVADQDAIALRLLATCHAQLGDFEAAYREMVDFHEAWTVRRSEQSEVLASVTHARFALDEARRDSERFRELAERDALTGLWNRRRSDDHLAALLTAPARDRGPLSVAILDLDHFKQINDTFSHAVGDDVLRVVAGILTDLVAPVGHAARHGGEEFLLLMTTPGDAGRQICEQIRRAVEGHDWSGVAPGLRVTTSVGMTQLRGTDDGQSVLARADARLYAAKFGGRNRVEVG
jgi:diguanylate cyclase (GGDEF)-like protein